MDTNELREAAKALCDHLESPGHARWNRVLSEKISALRAALSSPTQAGWRPIESAPRGSGEDGPESVRHPDYIEPPRILLATAEGIVVGYYDWYYHEGYGRGWEPGVSAWRDSSGGQAYAPTHWMPLPAPPSTAQAPEKEA